MSDDGAGAGGAATLYLVAIQVTSRLLTFIGNQFLLRYVSPSLLGLAVQLELLSVTILYSSRESLRVALQRRPIQTTKPSKSVASSSLKASLALQMQEAINMSYLVIIVGLFNSIIFGSAYLHKSSDEVLNSEDFWLALGFYAAGTILELCAEPFFVVIQQNALYKVRARGETMGAINKCIVACLVAFGMSRYWGSVSVRPFALGQAFYALTLAVIYGKAVLPTAHASGISLLPRKLTGLEATQKATDYWFGYFSKPLSTLTLTFYAQSIFKLFLTEGDRWILSLVADLHSQGAFALASNYGGLLSRLLFQPVEESSRNVFGRLLSTMPDAHSDVADTATQHSQPQKLAAQARSTTNIDRALTHLSTTLHLYTLFSLPLLTLLPYLFPIVVSNLVGARWSSPATTQLLSAYAYYLPFLAINGILDAFVTSAATPKQLTHQSIVMMFVTTAYGFVAWTLMAEPHPPTNSNTIFSLSNLAMGPVGLVWANIINMTLRISYSIWFITKWVSRHKSMDNRPRTLWRNSLPNIVCTMTAISVAFGLRIALFSNQGNTQKRFLMIKGLDVTDVGSFAAAAVVLASSMLFFEYDFLLSTLRTVVPQHFADKMTLYLPASKAKTR